MQTPIPLAHLKTESYRDANTNDFLTLTDIIGKKGTLFIHLRNECPLVEHAFPEILRIVSDYRVLGIGIVGFNSNDSLDSCIDFGFTNNMDFAYLYDENSILTSALQTQTCPDFYLFHPDGYLFYHGRLDDSLPGNGIPSGGYDLRVALDMLLAGRAKAPFENPTEKCKFHTESAGINL